MADEKAIVMVMTATSAITFARDHLNATDPASAVASTSAKAPAIEARVRQNRNKPQAAKAKGRNTLHSVHSGRVKKPTVARKDSAPTSTVPIWNDFQLIGDSMMSRFAQKFLRVYPSYCPTLKNKRLGLIVHGQTCSQLARLLKRDTPLHHQVILMIGTNDVVKNVPCESTERNLQRIVEILSQRTNKLVVLTLPPIPKLQDPVHLQQWEKINQVVRESPIHTKVGHVHVVDLASNFFKENMEHNEPNLDMFERFYKGNHHEDLVHWNVHGMQKFELALKEALHIA